MGVRDDVAAFSGSYRAARAAFLAAAQAAGLAVQSHVHPLTGLDGEELALDVVRDGPADATAMLVVSSGCHGVEGYCGSGVQVAALRDVTWRAQLRTSGVAVLYLHALNPWGFSWRCRVTHENADLNRNFQDFSQPLPANPGYDELHPFLVPAQWPPDAAAEAGVADFVARNGMTGLQAAVSRGQHRHPDGLFFGGTAPTWSNQTIRAILRAECAGVRRLGWIDIHTGLGPSGHGERIFADHDNAVALARVRDWWARDGATVTSVYDGSSTSAVLTGMLFHGVRDECPQAEYTGMALEYGTHPVMVVMHALRASNWLNQHPEAPAEQAAAIRQLVLDGFYTQTDDWKRQILTQAAQAMEQGVRGLAG